MSDAYTCLYRVEKDGGDPKASTKPDRFPVFETLLEKPVVSLGLNLEMVQALYQDSSLDQPALTLQEKLSELKADFTTRQRTIRSHARRWNLFLVRLLSLCDLSHCCRSGVTNDTVSFLATKAVCW